jgi:hypothetical protein
VTAPVLGPLGLLDMVSKKSKSVAFVVFPSGTVHHAKIGGNGAVRSAQREVVEFNAIVAADNKARPSEDPAETPVRLACGHVAFIADPKILRWLSVEGEKSYWCRTCEDDQSITATGQTPYDLQACGASRSLVTQRFSSIGLRNAGSQLTCPTIDRRLRVLEAPRIARLPGDQNITYT